MLIVLIAFTVLLLIGMPVAFAIGISGALFFLQHPELPATIPIQLTVTETQNFALLAVPLFILAGNFLNNSGITDNLLKLATVLTGRMHGRPGADLDRALDADERRHRLLDRRRRDERAHPRPADAQARLLARLRGRRASPTARCMAPIIPPGIGFILYGTVGQVSIGRLFAAGIIPGLMLWAALAIAISITARRRGYKPEREKRADRRARSRVASWGGIWAILFPDHPAARPALRRLHAVRDRRLRGRLRGRDRLLRLPHADAAQASAKRWRAAWSTSARVMFLLALSAIFGYGIVFERMPEVDLRLDARHHRQRRTS